jgi:D-lactate dehydrogenase
MYVPSVCQVYSRVREGNYSLERLPWGFDMHGRTVGVLGTGKIGECFVRIMKGTSVFRCIMIGILCILCILCVYT